MANKAEGGEEEEAQEGSAISDALGSTASRRRSENSSESDKTQARKRRESSDGSDAAKKTSVSSIELPFRQRTEPAMPISAPPRENEIAEQSRTVSTNEKTEESSGTSTLYPHDAERKLRRGRRFSGGGSKDRHLRKTIPLPCLLHPTVISNSELYTLDAVCMTIKANFEQ